MRGGAGVRKVRAGWGWIAVLLCLGPIPLSLSRSSQSDRVQDQEVQASAEIAQRLTKLADILENNANHATSVATEIRASPATQTPDIVKRETAQDTGIGRLLNALPREADFAPNDANLAAFAQQSVATDADNKTGALRKYASHLRDLSAQATTVPFRTTLAQLENDFVPNDVGIVLAPQGPATQPAPTPAGKTPLLPFSTSLPSPPYQPAYLYELIAGAGARTTDYPAVVAILGKITGVA